MEHSGSVVLAVAAVVAACSTGPSPFESSGPPDIKFLAPAAVSSGTVVQLTLTNSSSDAIIVRPCPLPLQHWNGSNWDVVPDGSASCAGIEDTLAPGAEHTYGKEADVSIGTYRAEIDIRTIGLASPVSVTSNAFTVAP